MNWESAKKHCIDRNWQWSLELIEQAQKEINQFEAKIKKLEDEIKAN